VEAGDAGAVRHQEDGPDLGQLADEHFRVFPGQDDDPPALALVAFAGLAALAHAVAVAAAEAVALAAATPGAAFAPVAGDAGAVLAAGQLLGDFVGFLTALLGLDVASLHDLGVVFRLDVDWGIVLG